MSKCNNCGEPVKIIAVKYNQTVMCKKEKVCIVSDTGHFFKGYLLHECKNKKETKE